MKSLAIGRDDFKHIIENDSYYIDKTKFIEELLKDASIISDFCEKEGTCLITLDKDFKNVFINNLKFSIISL